MSLTGCAERVRKLFDSSATKCDVENVYGELKQLLLGVKFVSNNYLNDLANQGKISRCLEVCWCIPEEVSHKFVAIR